MPPNRLLSDSALSLQHSSVHIWYALCRCTTKQSSTLVNLPLLTVIFNPSTAPPDLNGCTRPARASSKGFDDDASTFQLIFNIAIRHKLSFADL